MQTRQSLLPEEINDVCFVDVKNHKDVFESLKSNVKVSFDGQRFAYKVRPSWCMCVSKFTWQLVV